MGCVEQGPRYLRDAVSELRAGLALDKRGG